MRRYLKNENGNAAFTACFLLSMMVVLMCVLIFSTTQITMMNVRNQIKNELASVGIRISRDTYTAMSEGSLDEYYDVLTHDPAYLAELKQSVVDGIKTTIDIDNDKYRISDVDLIIRQNGDSIDYTLTCNIECYLSLLGEPRTISTNNVELTGSHNIKNY